jgi:hypothetical protein
VSGFIIPARRSPETARIAAAIEAERAPRRTCPQGAWDHANTAYARLGRFVAAKEAGEPYEPIQHPKREEF